MLMKDKKFYPWLVVGLLWFVALLNYLDRQMLSTMKPSMMIDIDELVSAQNFGRLMAVCHWIYALMSPISGIIADRLNRKWLIVGSLFVWSGVTLLMGYATTFDQIFEKSQQIIDEKERNNCYTQLDSMLMEEAPVVVLFYDQIIRFTQKSINGLDMPPTNMLNLKKVQKKGTF